MYLSNKTLYWSLLPSDTFTDGVLYIITNNCRVLLLSCYLSNSTHILVYRWHSSWYTNIRGILIGYNLIYCPDRYRTFNRMYRSVAVVIRNCTSRYIGTSNTDQITVPNRIHPVLISVRFTDSNQSYNTSLWNASFDF